MSACRVKILLDTPDRSLRPGDRVSGQVEVVLDEAVTCRGLHIYWEWETRGTGKRTSHVCDTERLFAGSWQAGTWRYPFELRAPTAPLSYSGTLLQIVHRLRAAADIPWAIDPQDVVEIELLPGPGATCWPAGLVTARTEPKDSPLAWLGLAILLFAFGFPCSLGLIPILLLVLPGPRRWVASQRLGPVAVQVEPRQIRPGQPFTVSVRHPRAVGTRAQARLVCTEVVVRGRGDKNTTLRRAVAGEFIPLDYDPHTGEGHGTARAPLSGAWSFEAPFNQVIWTLELSVGVSAWPDWTQSIPLALVPPTVAELAELPPEAALREGRLPERLEALPLEDQLAALGALADKALLEEAPPPAPPPPPRTPARTPLEADWTWTPAPERPAPPPAPPAAAAAAQPPPPAQGAAPQDAAALGQLSQQILASDAFGSGRQAALAATQGLRYRFTLRLERAERTFGFGLPEDYAEGRTVIGTLPTGAAVSVQLPRARNAAVEATPRGGALEVEAEVVDWSALYDRLEMRGL